METKSRAYIMFSGVTVSLGSLSLVSGVLPRVSESFIAMFSHLSVDRTISLPSAVPKPESSA